MTRHSISRRSLIVASATVAAASRTPHRLLAEATPVVGADDGSLDAMLGLAFDPTPDGGDEPTMLFAYADIARQLEVRGLRHLDPARADDERAMEWSDGLEGLYVDDTILRNAFTDAIWDGVGFDPSQIDQTLIVGDPPRQIRIFRGRFDDEAIVRASMSSGYELVAVKDGSVYSSGTDGEISLTHPVQGIVLSALNNLSVGDGSHVVAGAFLADVEAQLAVMAGNEATLANDVAVATILSAVEEELVSATILNGAVLSAAGNLAPRAPGAATPASTASIPSAAAVLFGLTPGSMPSRYTDPEDPRRGDHDETAPRSELLIALHLGSEGEAGAAVPVIEHRLAVGSSLVTNEPYSTFFDGWDVSAVPGTPVATVRIRGERVGRRWPQMVFARDYPFVFTL